MFGYFWIRLDTSKHISNNMDTFVYFWIHFRYFGYGGMLNCIFAALGRSPAGSFRRGRRTGKEGRRED